MLEGPGSAKASLGGRLAPIVSGVTGGLLLVPKRRSAALPSRFSDVFNRAGKGGTKSQAITSQIRNRASVERETTEARNAP